MANNPLPSWNEGSTRQSIIDFVEAVTNAGGEQFVPAAERIAVFDNDGTLWCEKPMVAQVDFVLRKLAEQAEAEPTLRGKQPWQAAWEKDFGWLSGVITKHYLGDDSDLKILLAGALNLAAEQSVEQLEAAARAFVFNERHPTLDRAYRECIYQPMQELLQYLEGNGFTNYIVSGGGRDFMRGFAEDLYGIPRERVIGSAVSYQYVEDGDGGKILQQAAIEVVDDGPGKPVQIWSFIGRRPILAAGNANGDLPMLAFAGGPSLPALRLLVVHDDAENEFAYAAGAEKAISTAEENEWTAVSMRDDWSKIFPRKV